jgi:hypothetical protein
VLANNTIAGFELPRFDLTITLLGDDSVDVSAQVLGLNGAPCIDPLTKETDVDLTRGAHGKAPLPAPYLNWASPGLVDTI